MLSLLFSSLLLCLLTGFTRQARGDLISTDYDRYNSGKLGHRPHLDFVSSPEFAPMLQVNAWDEGAVSARGSHIFLRHDGNETALLASPLVLDARDLSAVYMNRSFANVFGTRVQDNWGTPYLTFWEGQKGDGLGDGWGLAYDQTYRLAYNVSTRNLSAHADLHEFALTGHGTALLTGVDRLTVETKEWRARGYRGPSRLQVLDAVFQEIDLETNEVLFDWRALDHIDPMDSYERWSSGWDIFHMNSIEKTMAGNYLISIRHTHSIHLIDGTNGDIIWTLGGKQNDFQELEPECNALAPLLEFSWQHHPRYLPGTNETEMTFFDNHGKSTSHGVCPPGHCSRGLHIAIDDTVSPPTVQLLNEYTHPAQLRAQSQGSVQPLLNEDKEVDTVFIGWGRCPSFTEHTPEGEVIMDVQFSPWHSKDIPDALDNYRAYKMDWTATPWWDPSLALKRRTSGSGLNVYVSWNGATEVREWVVRTSATGKFGQKTSKVLAKSARTGFETMLTIQQTNGLQDIWAEALDESGKIIGSTDVVDLSRGEEAIDEWEEQDETTSGDGIITAGSDSTGDEEDEEQASGSDETLASDVGMILTFVVGGLVGSAAVAYGVVMAWRRYSREYDRLEIDDNDEDELDVEECNEYANLIFAPEAIVTGIHSRPEPWQGLQGKSTGW